MTECAQPVEKLFLSKGENQDVYVDICKHTQHQIDGIRFLYKQFKKKNPAVILNDPSGYGKSLQVLSLISALRPSITKPVLILCDDDDDIMKWKKQFDKWSSHSSDVETQAKAPFKKDKVYISTIDNVHMVARGEWSIMVVHLDNVPKHINKVKIKADYNIFVTSIDMKENLDLLTQIYKYLCPNDKFLNEISNFKANKEKFGAVKKSILLDSLLEDTVIRRNDFHTPFIVNQKKSVTPKKVRESKDITGTKIKRSKRKIEEVPSSTIIRKNMKTIEVHHGSNTVSKSDNKIEPMDIESFIRDQEPISSDGFRDCELDNISKHDSDDNTFYKLSNPDQDKYNDKTQEINHAIVNNGEAASRNSLCDNSNVENNESSSPRVGIFEETDDYKDRFNFDNINENGVDISAMDIPGDDYPMDIQNPIDDNVANENQFENLNDDICESENITLVDTKVINNGNESKSSKIDSMITELEERTLKKFKGSLLDSIF